MNVNCVKCGEEIHPLRIKALPNTKVCVNCSTTGTYRAITTVNGEGDHTWNDIQLMTSEEYDSYQRSENPKKTKKVSFSSMDFEEDDDRNLQGPFIIKEEE